MRRLLVTVSIAALAAGCTVGGDYVRPSVDAPAGWRVDYPQVAGAADSRWWEQFGDAELDRLVDAALRGNQDVAAAAARVDQFIGQLQATRSQLYPQASYSLDASRNQATAAGTSPLPAGADRFYSMYQGALGAQWQIDLFGRVRRLAEAAQARVYSTEQARRGVVMSVTTSVVSSYVALRTLDRQLEIARDTAKNYGETLRIFELRFKGGVVSQVELEQVRSQYLQAQAAIPALERQVGATENMISMLLGGNPGSVARGRSLGELAMPGIPAGLPSSLLERRPDVLQAEQNLVAANASIGAAKALYYPQISLTGMLGSVSTAMSSFLSGPAATGSIALGLAGPLFTAGSIAGQVASAEAAEREAQASYRQVVLNAFRETGDALLATVKARQQAAEQAKQVESLREYARLSRMRFDNGYAGYLEVLYAENTLFAAELSAIGALGDQYAQVVGVYKAMGGGWIDVVDPASAAQGAGVAERAARQPLF